MANKGLERSGKEKEVLKVGFMEVVESQVIDLRYNRPVELCKAPYSGIVMSDSKTSQVGEVDLCEGCLQVDIGGIESG
jgi:hypothetical protein